MAFKAASFNSEHGRGSDDLLVESRRNLKKQFKRFRNFEGEESMTSKFQSMEQWCTKWIEEQTNKAVQSFNELSCRVFTQDSVLKHPR